MAQKELVDWSEYLKMANFLRRVGYQEQSDRLKKLIRVGVALDRNDVSLAASRLRELPQKPLIGGA